MYATELNNLCWVTEISLRQVAFVAIMRPPMIDHVHVQFPIRIYIYIQGLACKLVCTL